MNTDQSERQLFRFSEAQLDVYGIYELQTLEQVLRNDQPEASPRSPTPFATRSARRRGLRPRLSSSLITTRCAPAWSGSPLRQTPRKQARQARLVPPSSLGEGNHPKGGGGVRAIGSIKSSPPAKVGVQPETKPSPIGRGLVRGYGVRISIRSRPPHPTPLPWRGKLPRAAASPRREALRLGEQRRVHLRVRRGGILVELLGPRGADDRSANCARAAPARAMRQRQPGWAATGFSRCTASSVLSC